jgi:hypothetical protein
MSGRIVHRSDHDTRDTDLRTGTAVGDACRGDLGRSTYQASALI